MKFEEDSVIFYKDDKQIPSEYHSRLLDVTASIHDIESRKGLVDRGSFLNIMSLSKLEEVEVTREQVLEYQ